MAGFGPNLGIYDPAAVTMLNDLNDRLGMDGKEASFLISMLMEGYEKGLIAKKDIDGMDLKWGNIEAVKKVLHKISLRKGVGDLLAEGVMRVSEELGGKFPDMAVFVKKGNAPHIHDPRTRWGTLFTQAIANTGTQEGVDMTSRANPELGFDRPTSEPDEYVGKVQALTGPKRQFEECLVFCYFQACSLKTMVNTLNTVTGAGYSVEDCLQIGRRVINLLRMFNKREGMTAEDDNFSPRLGQRPVDGPAKGKSFAPTFNQAKQAYYRLIRQSKPITGKWAGMKMVCPHVKRWKNWISDLLYHNRSGFRVQRFRVLGSKVQGSEVQRFRGSRYSRFQGSACLWSLASGHW
jgi:aldehyde:ferredoxin oxidoreductase